LFSDLPTGLKKILNQKQIHQPDEKPEMFFTQPKLSPIGAPPKRIVTKPPPGLSQPQPCDDFFNRNPYQEQCHRSNPFLADVTMSTTMPTELMSQMMNSYQQQQQRFNPLNPFNDMPQANQSFYERNLKFQQQQQLASLKRDYFNNSTMGSMGGSTGGSSSSSMSAFEASMQQQYSMMAAPSNSFYRYDPPKPDTPPSKPLWLDPVWNCDGNFFDNRGGSNGSGSYGSSDAVSSHKLTFDRASSRIIFLFLAEGRKLPCRLAILVF
jgi:hypothetical protein